MTVAKLHLSGHQLRQVAVAAGCDPRTVGRLLRGEPTHSTTAARIRDALVELKLGEPIDHLRALNQSVGIKPDREPAPREEAIR